MSSTFPNSTNATVTPSTSIMSNTTSSAFSIPTSSTMPQTNSTLTGAPPPPSNDTQEMITLLAFGPLSSCITLPDLSTTTSPITANMSVSAQQQVLHDWLSALPTQSSCTSFSWRFKPDYSSQLDAMWTLQEQLQQLVPACNLTASTALTPTVGGGNGSFFSSSPAAGAFSASNSSESLPESLPLWTGITVACVALVHLLALILHVCSDLDALFPSLTAKLRSDAEVQVLPSHVQPNESSTTLVEANQDAGSTEKPVPPPQYTAPTPINLSEKQAASNVGLGETPAPLRISRKMKRAVVPLLLVSALGMIAVAVVLNAKFAAGPVTGFSTPSSSGSRLTAAGVISNSTTSASTPTVSASDVIANATTRESRPAVTTIDGGVGVNATSALSDDAGRRSSTVNIDTPSTTVWPTSSMTKLVKRQINFFPTAASDAGAMPFPTPSTSATPSSSSTSLPNASLFPTLSPSSTSSALSALPTSITTTANTTSFPPPSTDNATTATPPAVFVLERGDSMHRLWWIVMLDLVLWGWQRRRTRSQVAMDRARGVVLAQLGRR